MHWARTLKFLISNLKFHPITSRRYYSLSNSLEQLSY